MGRKPYSNCLAASNLAGVYGEQMSSLLVQVLEQFVVDTEQLGQHSIKKRSLTQSLVASCGEVGALRCFRRVLPSGCTIVVSSRSEGSRVMGRVQSGREEEGAMLRYYPALFVPNVVETNLPKGFANSGLRKEGRERR